LLSVFFNTLAGYAFAKLQFRAARPPFARLLAALVIPGQVAMMPLFLMMKPLHLVNTYMGAVVPGMAGVFGIFLVRQYARSLPDELIEAARIDGAGEWRIFFSIVLPALRPILVTLAVFSFLGAWNDFMWPLIVLSNADLQTLPVALASLSREHVQDNELMMAGAVVTVLPVLLLFLLLQRHYMRGLLMGAVKGLMRDRFHTLAVRAALYALGVALLLASPSLMRCRRPACSTPSRTRAAGRCSRHAGHRRAARGRRRRGPRAVPGLRLPRRLRLRRHPPLAALDYPADYAFDFRCAATRRRTTSSSSSSTQRRQRVVGAARQLRVPEGMDAGRYRKRHVSKAWGPSPETELAAAPR
jgi:multiple sugar transport system permease protein